MCDLSKENLKKIVNDIVEDYDEQIDLHMKMTQEFPEDLLIRKKELQNLLKKLGIR